MLLFFVTAALAASERPQKVEPPEVLALGLGAGVAGSYGVMPLSTASQGSPSMYYTGAVRLRLGPKLTLDPFLSAGTGKHKTTYVLATEEGGSTTTVRSPGTLKYNAFELGLAVRPRLAHSGHSELFGILGAARGKATATYNAGDLVDDGVRFSGTSELITRRVQVGLGIEHWLRQGMSVSADFHLAAMGMTDGSFRDSTILEGSKVSEGYDDDIEAWELQPTVALRLTLWHPGD